LPSDNSGEETPVPIPNTEVKLSSADGSWGQRPCKSRSLLGNYYRKQLIKHKSLISCFYIYLKNISTSYLTLCVLIHFFY
jgi:hypothetical protein